MVDLSVETINRLFIEQISDLTAKACNREDSFDQQFSEWWLR